MKTLVCLVSKQTIPNYLFIKDHVEADDRLLFFYTEDSENFLVYLKNSLNLPNEIIAEKINPEDWCEMFNQIKSKILANQKYLVNFTCGTSYMSMALRRAFEGTDCDAEFFYTPYPKNIYLRLDKPNKNIEHRLKIDEYLSLYNVSKKNKGTKDLVESEEYTARFFELFVSGKINNLAGSPLDLLREYRKDGVKDIHETESNGTQKKPQIVGFSDFLEEIGFACATSNKLSKAEVKYLTGGWFEEYIYSLIKTRLNPDDITMGLLIGDTQNDLDVVFTLGNKLFVCECKTGINKFTSGNVSSMFSEIVYKLAALKDSLGNLSANTYICALTPANELAEKIAIGFGQNYKDEDTFVVPEKTTQWIGELKNKAKLNTY